MFCYTCGREISTDQNFCSVCGKPVPQATAPYAQSRLRKHIQILAILWILYCVYGLSRSVMLMSMAHGVFVNAPLWPGMPSHLPAFIGPLLGFMAVLKAVKSIAGLIAGIGLLQRASWARVLTLVLGFLSLLGIPLGTALGIYTIWVLLAQGSEQEYATLRREAAAV